MSGKYSYKKHICKEKNNRPIKIAITLLSIVLVGLLLFASGLETNSVSMNPPQVNMQNQSTEQTWTIETNPPVETNLTQSDTKDVTVPIQPEEQYLFDLGSNVRIIGFISYAGAFMEDRTDEVVTDVLGIQVKNTGEEYIQTMDITLLAGDTQAQFSLSTLFPGETVVVLEKNRMAYSTAPEFDKAQTSKVARFAGHPGMCQDKLKIQCLDGVINITNISGEDITEDVLIYYKNYVSGVYYGGITYRIRIEGGLKAGEIHQGTAAHFNPDNSIVVFVTCG